MNRFSISTSWNARSSPDALSMIREIKGMGFNRVELNFTLTSKDICDIISIKDKEKIEITGLHNFCPIPEGTDPKHASPDYYSLASLDDVERREAIKATKITIETAKRLDATFVILHLGRVGIKDKTKKLFLTLNDEQNYKKIKDLMLKERKSQAPKYFDKAISSIEELLPFAQEYNVILGVENRYYYSEIPSLDEMEILFGRFKSNYIGYWHDVGHAQIFQNIGLSLHRDYLDRLSPRIVGLHLHDIIGIEDHKAPLQGDFDFSMLKPYIKKDTALVLEPHYQATSSQIIMGARYLEELYGEIG